MAKFPWARRHRLKLLAIIPVAILLAKAGDTFFEDDNFRVVTSELYRAGQLRSDEWRESLNEHSYRSVINLRGGGNQPWYIRERTFAAEHGLVHFDFHLSDRQEPSVDTMKQLVALMRDAPKPLLVHCQAGADRSGLAAALYLYAVDGRSSDEAKRQLSLWYGHIAWLNNQTVAMDKAFAAFTNAVAPSPGT